jgi:dihydrofolate synthase/folylpolyglutamate synthase
MQFDEALKYLLSLGHETLAMKLGLRSVEILLDALGNPQKSFPSVQIAGTNGKGSTAAFIESILGSAGIRSGLYTSPHLVSITERIRVNGEEISRDDFARLASKVRETAEHLVSDGQLAALPTFFEQVTAIALLAFQETGVALAVLETGLGGRLDATTCAQAETVVITSIAMDHETYLGNSIEEIAAEKAAIIRPGVTAIIAHQSDPVRAVVLAQSAMNQVLPVFDDTETRVEDVTEHGRLKVSFQTHKSIYGGVRLGLRGRHQMQNASLAVVVAEALEEKGYRIPETAIVKGIANAQHPGRLELIEGEPSVLLDGAHNPAGAQTLRNYLVEFASRPVTLVFGVMNDKKVKEIAEVLFPVVDRLVLTEVNNARTADLQTLKNAAKEFADAEKVHAVKDAGEAVRFGLKNTPGEGLVCVAGSLYLIGEVRESISAQVNVR